VHPTKEWNEDFHQLLRSIESFRNSFSRTTSCLVSLMESSSFHPSLKASMDSGRDLKGSEEEDDGAMPKTLRHAIICGEPSLKEQPRIGKPQPAVLRVTIEGPLCKVSQQHTRFTKFN
jgi:hypothetical protein